MDQTHRMMCRQTVTTTSPGDGYAPAPEVDHKEHVPQRRAAKIFAFPTVTTLFQRRRIEAIQYYSSITETLQSMSDLEWAAHEQECPDFTNRVLDAARDVNDSLNKKSIVRDDRVTLGTGTSLAQVHCTMQT